MTSPHLLTRYRLPCQRMNSKGFTLPEVLIACIIFAILAGVTAQVMIGSILQGRRLETAQRHREDFSRLNHLIQIEASEAEELLDQASDTGPTALADCNPPNGATGFTLYVQRNTGSYGNRENRSGIQYYNEDFDGDGRLDIVRCGPPVTRNGQLAHQQSLVTGMVLSGASFASIGQAAEDRSIDYTVDFDGGNFGTAGNTRTVSSHRKSVFVCNPASNDPNEAAVGDCP